MKISELFKRYNQQLENSNNILEAFDKSKMNNESEKLDYGFFPLGSGILDENCSKTEIAEINNCEIMVLGNDFGNIDYFNKCVKHNYKEKNTNATIKNLKRLNLKSNKTFHTNLFLGLRQGKMVGLKTLNEEYIKFCITFFKTQLEFINPKIVLCLGNEVKESITFYSKDFELISSKTFTKLYSDENKDDFIVNSNGRKFIFIPHPSYAHFNWTKNNIEIRIKEILKNASR